jgi:hypothetical protein
VVCLFLSVLSNQTTNKTKPNQDMNIDVERHQDEWECQRLEMKICSNQWQQDQLCEPISSLLENCLFQTFIIELCE